MIGGSNRVLRWKRAGGRGGAWDVERDERKPRWTSIAGPADMLRKAHRHRRRLRHVQRAASRSGVEAPGVASHVGLCSGRRVLSVPRIHPATRGLARLRSFGHPGGFRVPLLALALAAITMGGPAAAQ